ncbi:hypothetical protein QFZ94_004801 [Paraburkholderia sp. JPY465]|uniref:tail fiber domain-containing protein n=1 Tax=Paraburkholderia sp. JPY465 TaxID=3042285 RepID=UPI003D1B2499
MTALQKIILGTPPTAVDGDTARTANTRMNSNVDVLNSQAALTSATGITAAQALTVAHVGKRINIALASAGAINLPSASTCTADSVLLLRNIGTTVVALAITAGSGDTIALSKLNPGESALMDTDGVHTWSVLMRGRTNSDNEVVNGNCTVGGNETVTGTLAVTGASTLTGNVSMGGSLLSTTPANPVPFPVRPTFNGNTPWDSGNVPGTSTGGVFNFTNRPTFAGKTPWDSGNLVSPMTLDTAQHVTGVKAFDNSTYFTYSAWNNAWNTLPLYATSTGIAGIGFMSNSGATPAQAAQIILVADNSFHFNNYNNSGYVNIVCGALTQASDRAIKTDIVPITGVMEKIRKLRAVSYVDKQSQDKATRLGVIAQDVAPHFPELVHELQWRINEDGEAVNDDAPGRNALGVRYANFIAPLLQGLIETDATLQQALERIKTLESK